MIFGVWISVNPCTRAGSHATAKRFPPHIAYLRGEVVTEELYGCSLEAEDALVGARADIDPAVVEAHVLLHVAALLGARWAFLLSARRGGSLLSLHIGLVIVTRAGRARIRNLEGQVATRLHAPRTHKAGMRS